MGSCDGCRSDLRMQKKAVESSVSTRVAHKKREGLVPVCPVPILGCLLLPLRSQQQADLEIPGTWHQASRKDQEQWGQGGYANWSQFLRLFTQTGGKFLVSIFIVEEKGHKFLVKLAAGVNHRGITSPKPGRVPVGGYTSRCTPNIKWCTRLNKMWKTRRGCNKIDVCPMWKGHYIEKCPRCKKLRQRLRDTVRFATSGTAWTEKGSAYPSVPPIEVFVNVSPSFIQGIHDVLMEHYNERMCQF